MNIQKKQIMTLTTSRFERNTAGNRRLAQWRVKWLIEYSTSHQIWCSVDCFVP